MNFKQWGIQAGARNAQFLSFLCSFLQSFCQIIGLRVPLGFPPRLFNPQWPVDSCYDLLSGKKVREMSDQTKDPRYSMSVVLFFSY